MATIRPLAANIARNAIRHGLFTWFRRARALCVPLYAHEDEESIKALEASKPAQHRPAEPQLTLPLRLRPQVQALLRQDRRKSGHPRTES